MKLIDQVCTIDQAKHLKELGVEQKSLFYFHHAFDKPVFGETPVTETGKQYKKVQVCNDKNGSFAAFTVAELGVMIQQIGLYTCVNTVLMGWAVHHVNEYADYEFKQPGNMNSYDTEAQARAAILIELLEDKKVSVSGINDRLKQTTTP